MKNKTVNLKLIYITAHSAGLVATQIKSVEVRLVFRTTTSCYSESTRSRECYPRESQMLIIATNPNKTTMYSCLLTQIM
jgi:hypothetical protein